MRTAAWVLVLAFALGSAQTLLCQFDCHGTGHTQPAATCHAQEERTSRLGAAERCDHEVVALLFVAAKLNSVTQPRAVSIPFSAPISSATVTKLASRLVAGPPGTSARPPSSTSTVLRI